jgi:hypothetical protein
MLATASAAFWTYLGIHVYERWHTWVSDLNYLLLG